MESFLTPYGLSNSGQEKLQFTPFWGGPKPVCSDGLRAGTIESHNLSLKTIDRKSFERGNFLVLHPVLLKIADFKSANLQLSIDVQPKEL